jgi:hypothetical protein
MSTTFSCASGKQCTHPQDPVLPKHICPQCKNFVHGDCGVENEDSGFGGTTFQTICFQCNDIPKPKNLVVDIFTEKSAYDSQGGLDSLFDTSGPAPAAARATGLESSDDGDDNDNPPKTRHEGDATRALALFEKDDDDDDLLADPFTAGSLKPPAKEKPPHPSAKLLISSEV